MTTEVTREAVLAIATLRRETEEHIKTIIATVSTEVNHSRKTMEAAAMDAGRAAERELGTVIDKANRATAAFEVATTHFRQQKKRLNIGLSVVVVLCLISLGATYQALNGYYHDRYATLLREVDFLEAINQSHILPCGDHRLCVRIDEKAARYGTKREYRVVASKL